MKSFGSSLISAGSRKSALTLGAAVLGLTCANQLAWGNEPSEPAESRKVTEMTPAPELRPLHPLRVEIEEASCRVRLAKVFLDVTDLRYVDGSMMGQYSIRVPLMPSKDEIGALTLPLRASPRDYFLSGGELVGLGHPLNKDEPPRNITATLEPQKGQQPEGVIRLRIDTGQRILEFDTLYAVTSGFDALLSQESESSRQENRKAKPASSTTQSRP